MDQDWDAELDATGLQCPLPVLKTRRRLRDMSEGQVLRILTDDPAAVVDFPHFCDEQGHGMVKYCTSALPFEFFVRKG